MLCFDLFRLKEIMLLFSFHVCAMYYFKVTFTQSSPALSKCQCHFCESIKFSYETNLLDFVFIQSHINSNISMRLNAFWFSEKYMKKCSSSSCLQTVVSLTDMACLCIISWISKMDISKSACLDVTVGGNFSILKYLEYSNHNHS